jgi:hypothetical protein
MRSGRRVDVPLLPSAPITEPGFARACPTLRIPLRNVLPVLPLIPSQEECPNNRRIKREIVPFPDGRMAQGVLGTTAGILVARHLKSTDELFDTRPSPRSESLLASAVQWAERIMRKVDSLTDRVKY